MSKLGSFLVKHPFMFVAFTISFILGGWKAKKTFRFKIKRT